MSGASTAAARAGTVLLTALPTGGEEPVSSLARAGLPGSVGAAASLGAVLLAASAGCAGAWAGRVAATGCSRRVARRRAASLGLPAVGGSAGLSRLGRRDRPGGPKKPRTSWRGAPPRLPCPRGGARNSGPGARSSGPGARRATTISLALGVGAAVLVGGPLGIATGLSTAAAFQRLSQTGRMPPGKGPPGAAPGQGSAEAQDTTRRLKAQLPLTADLLAACLGASGVPSDAAAAVSRAVGTPMRERLAEVAAELRMGADPAVCWERLAASCPALVPLGRCLARAGISGAPPAASLARLAEEQRAVAARAATARTRRAGVLATAPLGLCFLPAFVLIGIVPVVAGLAAGFVGRA
jgi:hypothetical protein